MANNGGRQGGGGGNQNMNEHVEFTVKAEEDLYLTGSENTIRRVTAETNYSCLMLKTQRFSSLFRHYAKYHGLRKDDLEYYFVNPLENEDTPESVQLQRGDTIMVRKRRKPDPPEPAADDEEFFKDMRDLLDDEEHMDALFLIKDGPNNNNNNNKTSSAQMIGSSHSSSGSSGNVICVKKEDFPNDERSNIMTDESPMKMDESTNGIEIRAHKCILTARSEYFKALFRKSAIGSGDSKLSFREATGCVVNVDSSFTVSTIQMMLEFLYSNRVKSLASVSTDDLLKLLHLSDMWSLRDLKRLVEHELIRSHMDVNTVARMYCATEDYNALRLSQACIDFIMENIREVTGNVEFQEEMKHYPHLCIPVLKAAADLIPEPMHKKQRTGDHSSATGSTPSASAGAGCASSPVPDIDA
uniref:BTB domain-containing protein n=1 Tax=Eucampia antarctica TaxID=49252 RepID=A0A7S2W5C8_9STRA